MDGPVSLCFLSGPRLTLIERKTFPYISVVSRDREREGGRESEGFNVPMVSSWACVPLS